MIKLIVTANDKLYEMLSERIRAKGQTPQRAQDVLRGFQEAERLVGSLTGSPPGETPARNQLFGIVVDMSLRAADTLIETLHSRQNTSHIPLEAVQCDGQTIPLTLRRLCTNVIETRGDAPLEEQAMGEL
jgi:hypothetical protein